MRKHFCQGATSNKSQTQRHKRPIKSFYLKRGNGRAQKRGIRRFRRMGDSLAKMSEWNLLLTQIEESIGDWPRELLPLIAGYLRVRVNDWHYELCGHESVTFRGRDCVVKHTETYANTTNVTSKYPASVFDGSLSVDYRRFDTSRWSAGGYGWASKSRGFRRIGAHIT